MCKKSFAGMSYLGRFEQKKEFMSLNSRFENQRSFLEKEGTQRANA